MFSLALPGLFRSLAEVMHLRPDHAPSSFPNTGQAVLLVIGAVALQVCCMATIVVCTTLLAGGAKIRPEAALNPWSLGAVNLFAIGIALALGLRASREPAGRFFAVRPFALPLLPAVVLTSLGLAIVMHEADGLFSELLHRVFGFTDNRSDILKLTSYPGGAFLLFVVVAPLSEEYLFRRMILHGLLARHRLFVAIGLSALLFGLMHLNFRQIFLGIIIGTAFGWWYARTYSIGPSLIGHAVFNSFAYFTAVLPEALSSLDHSLPAHPFVHQPWWVTLGGAGLIGVGLWRFKSVADSTEPPEPPLLSSQNAPPLLQEPPVIQPTDSPAS